MKLMVVVASAVLCALVSVVPAAAAKRPSCYRFGGTTVAVSPKVRVFYKWVPYAPDDERRFYGCLRRTGKQMLLTTAYGDQVYSGGPDVFRVHGTLVAWADHACGSEDCNPGAFTAELRSRKVIRSFADNRLDVNSRIVDLHLARSGSLGLMEADTRDPDGAGPYTYNVIAVAAGGSTVLDSGTDIDASSLALGGRWLYWTHAEEPRSALLR